MSPGTARTARTREEKSAGAIQRQLLFGHPASGKGGEANIAMGVMKEHTQQAGAVMTVPLRELQNEPWERGPSGAWVRPDDGPRDEQPLFGMELYRTLGRPASVTDVFNEPAPKRSRHVHFANDAGTRGAANSAASGAASATTASAASAVTARPAMPATASAATASAATATPVTASAVTASAGTAMTAMTGTGMPGSSISIAASALPEPHFQHDNNDRLRPHLTEDQTEIARRLQILKRNVEILLTSTTTYKNSLSSKNTRAFDKGGNPRKGTPIFVLSQLIKVIRNEEGRSRHQVLQQLYDAVENLKNKRTLKSWEITAKGAKKHYKKLDEVRGKLTRTQSQLNALLRAFVIAPQA